MLTQEDGISLPKDHQGGYAQLLEAFGSVPSEHHLVMHMFEGTLWGIEGDTDKFSKTTKDRIGNVHQSPQNGADDEAGRYTDQDEVTDVF